MPHGNANKRLLTCFLKMIGCTMYERMAFPEIVSMVGDIVPLNVMVKQYTQI